MLIKILLTLGCLSAVASFADDLMQVMPEEALAKAEQRSIQVPYFEGGKFKGYVEEEITPEEREVNSLEVRQGDTLTRVHDSETPPAEVEAPGEPHN